MGARGRDTERVAGPRLRRPLALCSEKRPECTERFRSVSNAAAPAEPAATPAAPERTGAGREPRHTVPAMPTESTELGYDAALRVLRGALAAAAANAQAFATRSQLGQGLLSARGWSELAEIEAELTRRLEHALRRELRADPWPVPARLHCWLRAQRDIWSGERATLLRQLREASALPLGRWRAGAPQLESALWPFFEQRTHHLANTLALALGEPAPFPAIIWHPGRREFRR
jgi:hypothetical protein